MNLRPYQQDAFDSIQAGWAEARRQLAVMATGGGKTILFSHLAAAEPGRTLILAHRAELIQQAVEKLHAATGIFASVEMGASRALPGHGVVVASVQSMKARLAKYDPKAFDLVIADEAHHCLASEWRTVLDHFAEARVLGVTATPSRSDNRKLGSFFERLACEVTLLDLIRSGYLSPIRALKLPVEVDVSALRRKRGDLAAGDVGGALSPRLAAVADAVADEIWGRKTLVFLPLCETSEMFAAALRERGIDARHVAGDSPDRAELLAWFSTPGPKCLCNAMLLTEGYDEPSVDCLVMLRATASGALYSQMVGRGTRLSPGKDYCLILDPLWITGDHRLCKPADICAGSPEHRDALQAQLDLGEDLLEAEEKAQVNMAESLEKKLAEAAKKKAPRGLVDPVAWALALHDGDLAQWTPTTDAEAEPATEGQLRDLLEFGLWTEGDAMCRGYAAALLRRVAERKRLGLASPKQVALLRKLGLANCDTMTAKEAGYFIGNRPWGRRAA
jgi:superfamily II DNA or RNA helicase